MDDTRRRLCWHGVFLFFLALLSGVFMPVNTNPRMALAAHTAGIGSGTFLAVVGALWNEMRLGERSEAIAVVLLLFGLYGGWLVLQLAAIWGTSGMTPVAGAGHAGAPWQELLVGVGLTTTGVALLVACVLLLRGLGRRAPA
jgi:hydroxylaminobenzene mutase